jgi:DNA invertase Pin-like site-specific DNA recombinase
VGQWSGESAGSDTRVSTEDQNLSLQLDALRAAGCDQIFREKVSGAGVRRRRLASAIASCAPGDILVVWKLDRLGRSQFELAWIIEKLNRRGVELKVLAGPAPVLDTICADGRMLFGILAVFAQYERDLNRERTKAGMEAARARGVVLGRPRKLTCAQVSLAASHGELRVKG